MSSLIPWIYRTESITSHFNKATVVLPEKSRQILSVKMQQSSSSSANDGTQKKRKEKAD